MLSHVSVQLSSDTKSAFKPTEVARRLLSPVAVTPPSSLVHVELCNMRGAAIVQEGKLIAGSSELLIFGGCLFLFVEDLALSFC